MAYGQIQTRIAAAAGIAHTVGTATFCAFIIQDITGAGPAQAGERAWVNTKAAATYTLNEASAASVWDVFLTTAYRTFDVGPVVASATRNNTTDLYTPWLWNAAGAPAALRYPSYRSLHTGISFANGIGAAGSDVQITHNLGTASVLVFASPTFDPVDTGGGGIARVFLQSIDNVNQVTLRSRRDAGGNFAANSPVTYDVMVMAAPTVGHSLYFPRHAGLAGGVIGAASYDYDGAPGARAICGPTFSAVGVVNRYPSATAGYANVDGIALIGGGGKIVTHNLGANARMALVTPIATPGLMVPYVADVAPVANPTTTITLAEIGAAGPMDNTQVLVLREYSMNRIR